MRTAAFLSGLRRPNLASVIAVLLLAMPAAAQGDAPAQEVCRPCEGRGALACRSCAKKSPCSGELQALHCSVVASCEACGGSGLRDCKRCDLDPLLALEAELEKTQAWWRERRVVDEFMEQPLVHLESAHFVLVYDIDRVSPGQRALKRHAGAHLYLDRLEAFRAEFVEDMGAEDDDFFNKTTVMLWQSALDQQRASREYTRQESRTESKLMGAAPVVSIYYDKSHLHEEFELHQAVVHQVAHCLLSNVFDGIWPGNLKGGWLDGGLAHAYEIRKFGGVRHYCYVEGDTMLDFKFGQWEPAVRIAVGKQKALPFLQVATKHTAEMTPEEHMFAWSFIDYVLRAQPGKLGALAGAIKSKQPIHKVTEGVFGQSPFAFHAAWEAWVLETYSTKKRRR